MARVRRATTVNVDRVGSAPDRRVRGDRACAIPRPSTRLIRDYYGQRDKNGNRKYRLVEDRDEQDHSGVARLHADLRGSTSRSRGAIEW